MESVISILGWALPVVMLVTLLFGFLMGLWRGIFKAALRLVSLIFALFLSKFLVQSILGSFAADIGQSLTQSLLPAEVAASPTVTNIMTGVSLALASPILFLVVYLLLNKLFLIVYALLKLAIRPLVQLEKGIPFHRLIGGGIGIICAFISLIVIMTPIGGYASIISDTVALVENSEQGDFTEDFKDTVAELKPLSDSVSSSPAVTIPYALGGRALFNSLSSFDVTVEEKTADGGSVATTIDTNLSTEIKGVVGIIPRATALADMHFESLDSFNIAPVRDLISALDEDKKPSHLAVVLVAQICSSASEAWIDGETYFGINLNDMLSSEATAAFKPSVNKVLEKLKNTSSKRVAADLTSLADTVDSISATYQYMLKLTDADHITTAEDVEELINNLTPEAVVIMRESVPAIIESSGFNTQDEATNKTVNKAANIMLDSLDKLASDPTISPEDKKIESAAINSMMNIVTTATDENKSITNDEADTLVNDMMTSVVLSETVITSAAEDDTAFDVDDHTSDTMRTALNKYESENAGNMSAEQQDTASALRTFFAAHDHD